MKTNDLLRMAVRTILERSDLPRDRDVLSKIDSGPSHMLSVDELEGDELEAAERLAMRGLVRRKPASRLFPERFVLTSAGTWETGTFEQSSMDWRPSR